MVPKRWFLACVVLLAAMPTAARGQAVQWTRQFGTAGQDRAFAIAADGAGVYVAGATEGTLPGQRSAGSIDAFVRKYRLDGTEVWTRQFGTSGIDEILALAVNASGVYVAGDTQGSLSGQTRAAGFAHAFVRKYDANGVEGWTRQFGLGRIDEVLAITVGASGVYVAGDTTEALPGQTGSGAYDQAFVRKYDLNGNDGWSRQFGSDSTDRASAVAVDATGVYVSGVVGGTLSGQKSLGDSDGFLRKYDPDGRELWTRQFGTSGLDEVLTMAVDRSGVYVAGITDGMMTGQISAGDVDGFVRKYNPNGTELWTRQLGVSTYDDILGIAVSASGLYIGGNTTGTLRGQTSAGGYDGVVRQYDSSGHEGWTLQFGTPRDKHDEVLSIAVDATGIYVAGVTEGALPGQANRGNYDAFVIKLAGR
jgi:hypothetical protein